MPLLDRHDLAALPAEAPDRRLPYGLAPSQFVDIYLPASAGPHPVALLLHGGCWRARVGLDYFGRAARALAACGVAVVNAEYRRLGEGGGWPATFEDVTEALGLLPRLADEHRLELSRLVLVGHSAGGQLALWLASRHRLPEANPFFAPRAPLRAVILLAGLPDLIEAAARGLCEGAPQELLGGSPGELPERYAQASPAARLPLGVLQVLVQGNEDSVVPHNYTEGYLRQAQAHGERLRLVSLAGCGHFEPVVVGTAAWGVVEEEIVKALEPQTGYAEGVGEHP